MICPICKMRETSFHITDASKKQKSLHICDECKKGISFTHLLCDDIDKLNQQHTQSSKTKTSKPYLLTNSIKDSASIQKLRVDFATCPKCGNSINNLLSKGILGCENDYIIYREIVESMLLESQGSALHKGKQYFHSENERQASRLSALEFNLKKAIDNENYELAGEITKEINTFKKP